MDGHTAYNQTERFNPKKRYQNVMTEPLIPHTQQAVPRRQVKENKLGLRATLWITPTQATRSCSEWYLVAYLCLRVAKDDSLCDGERIIQIAERVKLPVFAFNRDEELLDALQRQLVALD